MLFDSLIENSNLLIDLQRIVWNKLNFILKLVFFFDVSHGPSWLYGSWNNNYYAISAYPAHGEAFSIWHYVIEFVSDLRQVGGFPGVYSVLSYI